MSKSRNMKKRISAISVLKLYPGTACLQCKNRSGKYTSNHKGQIAINGNETAELMFNNTAISIVLDFPSRLQTYGGF